MTVLRKSVRGDKILLYGDKPDYYIKAKPTDNVEIGDRIEYITSGLQFGWFYRKINPNPSNTDKNSAD